MMSSSSQYPQYDRYGWPVDPVTGRAYSREECINNPALLDLFPAGHMAARAMQRHLERQANPGRDYKKSGRSGRSGRSRSSGKAGRKFMAATVLFPFETGMRATARRMAELKTQESAIPFDGTVPESEDDYEGSPFDRYAVQVGW
ncbi:MAG: hypothetical protein C4589_11730 [Peptococcaceae bacterium]|nr:MAG: hypothetical protein C4589_11730 [Peptococcaceae bacterium]